MSAATLLQRMTQRRPITGRSIGYVGNDLPIELILAAEAMPVGLCGDSARSTPHADRYLESTFTPAIRSIAEQWLEGELDDLEAVILSRSDDSAQRLYYYICELQRRGQCGGPKPLMYDIASCARSTSVAYTIESTRALANELGTSPQALAPAIQKVQLRIALSASLASRTLARPAACGSIVHRALRIARCDWSAEVDDDLRRAVDASPPDPESPRLMLIGSAPPDERMHEAVEERGANIVSNLNVASILSVATPATNQDPFELIALRCRGAIRVWRDQIQAPESFCARALELDIAGAILWTIAEDTGLAWAIPRVQRALRERGIPVLCLSMQRWNVEAATLEAIAAFASELRPHA